MLFNEDQIKDADFSKFVSGQGYFSKGPKLFIKKDPAKSAKVTVGYAAYPFDSENFIFKKIGTDNELFIQPMAKNNFNIYYEKHIYIKSLDLIFPDVDKITALMNFHFERLLHYKVINKSRIKYLETQTDIINYCDIFNFPIISSFPWEKQKGAESHINNASNMCIYPTSINKFMIALAIRLPIKKNTMLKLYAIPNSDGSYLYGIRDVNSSRKNQLFLIDNMDDAFTYIEHCIFENTHYTKKMRDVLGVFTIAEYTDDNMKVYEMSKY